MPLKILFLCTGNSARSQMAEGIARHLGKRKLTVESAGLEPKGLHAFSIAVMDEIGYDIAQQKSKKLTHAALNRADIVITLCGHADAHCPDLSKHIRKEHWPLTDPARSNLTHNERIECFRKVRDEIQKRVKFLLKTLSNLPDLD